MHPNLFYTPLFLSHNNQSTSSNVPEILGRISRIEGNRPWALIPHFSGRNLNRRCISFERTNQIGLIVPVVFILKSFLPSEVIENIFKKKDQMIFMIVWCSQIDIGTNGYNLPATIFIFQHQF